MLCWAIGSLASGTEAVILSVLEVLMAHSSQFSLTSAGGSSPRPMTVFVLIQGNCPELSQLLWDWLHCPTGVTPRAHPINLLYANLHLRVSFPRSGVYCPESIPQSISLTYTICLNS